MIDESRLRGLLKKVEIRTVDFKAKPHRLDNEHFKSEFIKDVLAMANTPRDETAFIIIGVKLHQDGSRDLVGVTTHPDDSDLQDQFNLAKVEPKPIFVYQPITLDGQSYGVIEIPVKKNGPHFATRDYGVIKAHRLYFRRGTKNDEATIEEQNRTYRWFHDKPVKNTTTDANEDLKIPNWDEFALACHKFDKNRLYLVIVGPGDHSGCSLWKFLARLPLSLVLDFDPLTETHGVYSLVAPEMRKSRSVHLWTLGNKSSLVPEKACYWYASRGLQGLESSLVEREWLEWNRKYSRALQELLTDFARASGGRPLTVLCLWYAPEYVRVICSLVDSTFGDSANYVFAIPEANRLVELAKQFEGDAISIKIEDMLHGIAQNIASPGEFSPVAGIPRSGGTFHILPKPTLNWLEEDLEVLHSNIELETPEEREIGYDYLRGMVIDWADLNNHYDADRDKTSGLEKMVERELKARNASRLNLYHWPGAGGTTIARRIAWNLRRHYPVVMLRRVTSKETVGRFRELFSTTSLPILAIVEGADTIPDRLEYLYTEVKAENIPVVFLSVLRRFGRPTEGERTAFLGQNLSLPESHRFVKVFERAAPQRASFIEKILHKPMRERSPFQFALTAFGKDYFGIARYVESRLDVASPTQREIVTHLALAYYYGHKSILSQVFTAHLGQPGHIPLRLETILEEPQLELLIQEDHNWRPAHQLIAEEILKVVLGGSFGDRRNWKMNLPTWAIDFINICRNEVLVPSDDLLDLLRRVFILRDEHELLGTEGSGLSRFAQLIEDIPTKEGKLIVLKELTESFPGEAHFWGHLGRFYSVVMEEHEEAIKAIDAAIQISRHDPVLHHMKGMCYRKIAYARIKELQRKKHSNDEISQLQDIVENALETFSKARELDPYSEHAYISPTQLLLRVLDFGFAVSGCDSRADFLVSPSAVWYRELLDKIESLMESVRNIREGEKPSRYILKCQADLDQIYDNYSRALEGWNNLLAREDTYAPPIRRQIVRAYLSRSKRNWASLSQREIERVVDLMEDNLREEPGSEHNIRIWFRAIRYSSRQNIDVALDRLAHWKAIGDSQDAYFYLYVLHVLKAIDGSMIEQVQAQKLIEQSQAKSRYLRNRTRSYEWLGEGEELSRLVHHSELGRWDESTNFYTRVSRLDRVEGRISKINKPAVGIIEMSSCGLPVFFVPAKAGVERGRDENLRASFYLGFSYDGLRAWSVEIHR